MIGMLMLGAAAVASARPPQVVEMDQSEEVRMALSAAPENLRAEAGVYVLSADGFVAVRPSRNGFNCLVAREPYLGTGPLCFDREGSETLLKAELLRGELMRAGKSAEEIEATIGAGYAGKTLMAPRRAGIAYMLSTDFRQTSPETGRPECIFPPHVMIYAPYLKNSDIGSDKNFGSTSMPWILNEGLPNAYVIMVHPHADVAACK